MVYASNSEIKDRIEFDGQDFYDVNPSDDFDDLITTLEKESRAIINGQIGGETLEEETDRKDTLIAPDNQKLELVYPVNSVSKVEVYRRDGWHTLDSSRYQHTEQNLMLDPAIRREYGNYLRYRQINPLRQHSNELTWLDVGTRVRVTYDRGHSTIPQGVKEAQIAIINRQLTLLRQDQNISAMSPEEATQALNNREILTDDIKERMTGKISKPKNKYTVL